MKAKKKEIFFRSFREKNTKNTKFSIIFENKIIRFLSEKDSDHYRFLRRQESSIIMGYIFSGFPIKLGMTTLVTLIGLHKMKTHEIKIGNLQFSATHFLIGEKFGVEALHGHNFGVEITFRSKIDADGIVVDFAKLRAYANEIIEQLNHKLLIPAKNSDLKIELDNKNISISANNIALMLKTNNVIQIPFVNTSAELIAEYFAQGILTKLRDSGIINGTGTLKVGVSEEPGCIGICTIEF